jgi:Fe-S-cluster containining protein
MQEHKDILITYSELLSEVDAWFARCSLAAGDLIACRRGCSACCRGLFDITLLDAALLKQGFDALEPAQKQQILLKGNGSLDAIRTVWPDFDHPYLLNSYSEEQWDLVMPDEDETPCPLLGGDGQCLVYDSRPMTCRLNGIPMLDLNGEVLFDEWCSLNFTDLDPLIMQELRFDFNDVFGQEQLLFREFTKRLFGKTFNELDTLIPTAIKIDFKNITLSEKIWSQSCS